MNRLVFRGTLKTLKTNLARYCTKELSSSNVVQLSTTSPKKSATIKNLFDRFLLTTTFPCGLLKNLADFDELPSVVYAGLDPTSDSLHIGHLLIINNLLHLYAAGYDVIVLIGGATCKLGDPSGRTKDREEMEWSTIVKNSESLLRQIEAIFTNFSTYIFKGNKNDLKPVHFVNNAKWYSELNAISFLDKYGRLFRIKHFIEKSVVRDRAASMNINEFMYQMFQAYDFLKLYDDFGCLIQIGGTDQTGNVHSGHDLIQKVHEKNAVGLFAPLLTTDDGEKLGKSVGNAIHLNPIKTTAFEFYQHFLRLPDAQLQKYFYLLTFLSIEEIDLLCDRHMKRAQERKAQKTLAHLVTLLVHGEQGYNLALRASEVLYSNKIETLIEMTPEEVEQTFKGVPSLDVNYRNDFTLFELISATGYFRTDDIVEEEIIKGGVYVNLLRIQDPNCILVKGTHILPNGLTVLRFGKKNYFLIRWKQFNEGY